MQSKNIRDATKNEMLFAISLSANSEAIQTERKIVCVHHAHRVSHRLGTVQLKDEEAE